MIFFQRCIEHMLIITWIKLYYTQNNFNDLEFLNFTFVKKKCFKNFSNNNNYISLSEIISQDLKISSYRSGSLRYDVR